MERAKLTKAITKPKIPKKPQGNSKPMVTSDVVPTSIAGKFFTFLLAATAAGLQGWRGLQAAGKFVTFG